MKLFSWFAKSKAGRDRDADEVIATDEICGVLADILFIKATVRLQLPLDEVSRNIPLAHVVNMSRAELQKEKADVKQDLKLFDMVFLGRLGRQPARRDKEVMRPLYQYYKYLRARLSGTSAAVFPVEAEEISANNESP